MSSELPYLLNTNSGSFQRSRSQLPNSPAILPPIPNSIQRYPTLALQETKKPRPLGFRNLGNTCYQNSVFQAVLNLETLSESLADLNDMSSLVGCLQELLRERDNFSGLPSNGSVQDGRRVRECLKSRMWRGREQQDALEFYLALVDQLFDEIKIGNFCKNFRGMLVTKTRCGRCQTTSTQKDPFFVIPLPIDSGNSLEEALRQFQSDETLEGHNSYACERCRAKTEASKALEFQELPEVLVFAFKRFRWTNQGRCEKNGKYMKFPINNLIVPCTGNSLGKKYDLMATVHHKGASTDSGHYTAHVRRDNKWYHCDDSQVSEVADVGSASVVAADTYLLFYQTVGSGRATRGTASGLSKSMLLQHQNHRQFSLSCLLQCL